MIKKLNVSNFAKLKDAEFNFKDLNLFVGPQASGKSLTLQLIKLLIDYRDIVNNLKRYNYDWKGKINLFPELYFGEGMSGLLENILVTQVPKGKDINYNVDYARGYDRLQSPQCFYIPAQRFLVIEEDWPKAFETFENKYPYVVREFSDVLRTILNKHPEKSIFPYSPKLKKSIKKQIEETIYQNSNIELVSQKGRKRVMLKVGGTDRELPMTLISTGQREFLPYLISLYHLLPAGKVERNGEINTVIIEEPEMGLHPQAIRTFLFTVIEMLSRNYRVFISTHSVDLMNYIWAFIEISQCKDKIKRNTAILRMLALEPNELSDAYLDTIAKKKVSVHYFKPENGNISVKDISKLPISSGDDSDDQSEWGGLLTSSDLMNSIISSL